MSRLSTVFVAALLLHLCSACAGAPLDCAEGEACAEDALKAGTFKLSPASANVTTAVGTAPAAVTATLTDSNKTGHGFKVTCTGAVATPATGSVSSTKSAVVSFQAPAPAAAGSSKATCTLSSTSGANSNATFALNVTATGGSTGFTVALSPASQTVSAGAAVSYAVTTTSSAPVALSASGLPSSVTGAFSAASASASAPSKLVLSAASSAAPTTSTFTVTGTDAGGAAHSAQGSITVTSTATRGIQTVWLILMENHNWSKIHGSASAPYINGTLLPMASRAENYWNPTRLHPSEPNYLWLEAGTNFGVTNDSPPSANHQASTAHLANLLENKGLSWRSYQEDISGAGCPLTNTALYNPKHNPFVYFDDVMNDAARCQKNVRPYAELSGDLAADRVAAYNFVTPNLCNDMHNSTGCATTDAVKNGDAWLSKAIPPILASAAYKRGGAIFITWDESEGGEFPIGMIVLSPQAKGGGYAGAIRYTHSSMLRTAEEIFGVTPLLGDAANATDLADLFKQFP
jgi:hypothetical protein